MCPKTRKEIRAISKNRQKMVLASVSKIQYITFPKIVHLKIFLIVGSVLIADLYPSFLVPYINQTYENKKKKETLTFSTELSF